MSQDDKKLSALLKEWRDIEPSGSFEADVRRRIRLAQAEEPELISVSDWLRWLFRQPAFSTAVAVAIVIGAIGGMRSNQRSRSAPHPEVGFLSSGTLAGSYAQLVTGDSR